MSRGWVAASCAVLLASACATTTASRTTAGPVSVTNACALLDAATIARAAGFALPEGVAVDPAVVRSPVGWSICNWEDVRARVAVQVQLHPGAGRTDFDRRRSELGRAGAAAVRVIAVSGADAAFDQPDQGVVGILVGRSYAQVSTVGADFDEGRQLALAAAVVKGIDQ